MRYFGNPRCPYCNKKVNLIRRWSLCREGEYKCPRCQGISNIFLSPLLQVTAVLAIFVSGVIYFFHRFIVNDVKPRTLLDIVLPFGVFYVLSLFMVYLEKPVLKKKRKWGYSQVPASGKGKKAPARKAMGAFQRQSFEEKLPEIPEQPPAPPGPAQQEMLLQGSVAEPREGIPERRERRNTRPQRVQQPVPGSRQTPEPFQPGPKSQYVTQQTPVNRPLEVNMPIVPRKLGIQEEANREHVVQKLDVGVNPFRKYEDPDYVERRIKEEPDQDSL